jgi:hypothetical protein
MLKIIVSSVAFVLLGAFVFYSVQKIPDVQDLVDCYQQSHEIYDQKSLVLERSYRKESTICERNKQLILRGAQCFYRTEPKIEALDQELIYLKQIAKVIARKTNEIDQIVDDHNQRCTQEDSSIKPHELEKIKAIYQ